MPTTRKPIKRLLRRRITNRALDLFESMQTLEQRCSCGGDIKHGECGACKEWWEQNWALHGELHLKPWQWPAYGDYEDTNKTGVLERYLALKAASDARKRAA